MPIAIHPERDNLYRVEISGTLRKEDLDRCQELLAVEIDRIGPVRLLFLLSQFEGWEANANWSDLSFFVKRGDAIERIAVVGPPRWRNETLMFAGADLRKAPVEFFPAGGTADARAWLSS